MSQQNLQKSAPEKISTSQKNQHQPKKSAPAHQESGPSAPSISQPPGDDAADHQTDEVEAAAQAHLLKGD